MIAKLRAFWCQLPQGLQAGIVTFTSAAGVGLLDAFSDNHFSKHDLISSISAGAVALRAFYMIPNRPPQPPQPPDVAAARLGGQ